MKTGYMVADIMTNDPVRLDNKANIRDCAEAMRLHDVGSILIMNASQLLGIVTEKDIVFKVTVKGLSVDDTKAVAVMTPKDMMTLIEPSKDIYDALIVMKENKVRRLPVMDGDKLAGLITLNDILKIEPDLFDIMVERITLREEDRKLNMDNYDDVEEDEDNL